jgi:hypothetical protein
MISMDFTTTAMARPALFDRTLNSFSSNLKDVDLKECRLFVNVDPLPPKVDRMKVVEVGQKYFGEVIYNFPDTANFTAAVNWIWKSAGTKCIFHLEDDWQLVKPIVVEDLLVAFKKNKKLLQIILRAYRYNYGTCVLSPSIIHKRMYKAVGGNLRTDLNPEAQLRGERFGISMPRRIDGKANPGGRILVYPKPGKQIILRDLGRKWITKTNYRKTGEGKKARFITWETK